MFAKGNLDISHKKLCQQCLPVVECQFLLLLYLAFLEELGIMFGSYLLKFHVVIGLVLSFFICLL